MNDLPNLPKDAALSQTAGVPDRKTLFEQAEVLAACYRLKELVEGVGCERWQNANGFRLKDTQQWVEFYNVVNRMQRLEYPPAAAPAASGGEEAPSASVAGRALEVILSQSPSGASVSERARSLFNAMLSAPYGDTTMGNIVYAATTRNRLESAWLPLIERALSSPRQEGGSTAASTQGLRELVQRWREEAEGNKHLGGSWHKTDLCNTHADELESLLTSPTTGADGGGK